MNYNKFCDIYDCSYDNYYVSQAGGGNPNEILSFYRGVPYQRGFNFFTRFGKKYAVPLLKYLGKKAFSYGKNVAQDILAGEDPKDSLKKNLKRSANETIDDVKNVLNQTGKRRRKKRIIKRKRINRKPTKKKRRVKNKVKIKKKSRRVRRKRRKNIFDHV